MSISSSPRWRQYKHPRGIHSDPQCRHHAAGITPLVVFDTLVATGHSGRGCNNPGAKSRRSGLRRSEKHRNQCRCRLYPIKPQYSDLPGDATAFSGLVDVTNNVDFDVPGDGPFAISSASANAFINSVVRQSNENIGASVTPPIVQIQNATQTNTNTQNATATAVATTDDVSLVQNGAVTAGGNGLTALNNALATAAIVETATQRNSNSWTVTGTTINQNQTAAQTNTNAQNGTANAVATSGDVSVVLNDWLDAGGNGITASSNAAAAAAVTQTATQSNSNSATATNNTATAGTLVQNQNVSQRNFNTQSGTAVAQADSGDVSVLQNDWLEADGSGITASSNAAAAAAVTQDATQTNTNDANATGNTVGGLSSKLRSRCSRIIRIGKMASRVPRHSAALCLSSRTVISTLEAPASTPPLMQRPQQRSPKLSARATATARLRFRQTAPPPKLKSRFSRIIRVCKMAGRVPRHSAAL